MKKQEQGQNIKSRFDFIPDGPVRVSGPFELKDAQGNKIETAREIYLCTCGNSANKPFCDGSHKHK